MPVPVDALVVVVMSAGRSQELAYLNEVLSQEIASITEDNFDTIIGDSISLQCLNTLRGWQLPRFHLKRTQLKE